MVLVQNPIHYPKITLETNVFYSMLDLNWFQDRPRCREQRGTERIFPQWITELHTSNGQNSLVSIVLSDLPDNRGAYFKWTEFSSFYSFIRPSLSMQQNNQLSLFYPDIPHIKTQQQIVVSKFLLLSNLITLRILTYKQSTIQQPPNNTQTHIYITY